MKRRIERRVKRYPVRLPVKELNGRPADGTFVVDLSSLGARLETDTPLAPRNLVEFTVILPDHEIETRLYGRVIWLRPLLHFPGRFNLGLCFFGPNWDIDRLARTGKL
ncbi:MAG: PilZ domain-containing protein [Deltaproteobacteria bacterium]|nr:PilZ domain-containing protein [Deltaproteobacteria bacterium]